MKSFRCPGCHRTLRLPAQTEARTGKCPLCQTTFELPADRLSAEDPPPVAVPVVPRVPVPEQPWSPPSEPANPARPVPWQRDAAHAELQEPAFSVSDPAAKHRRSAAAWLRFMAIVGLLQNVSCSCCQWHMALTLFFPFYWPGGLVGFLAIRVVLLLVILRAASSLGDRRRRKRPWLAAWFALSLASVELVPAVAWIVWLIVGYSISPQGLYNFVLMFLVPFLVNLSVAVSGLIGGIQVLRLPAAPVEHRSARQ